MLKTGSRKSAANSCTMIWLSNGTMLWCSIVASRKTLRSTLQQVLKVSLIRKYFILLNEAVPWVKTNGDTKNHHAYMQIGKDTPLQSPLSWKSAIFLMTSHGKWFTKLRQISAAVVLYLALKHPFKRDFHHLPYDRKFWWIGGFQSNPPISHSPKASQCDVIIIAKS